ncbi:putative leader peptide [Streptomyces durbertensis]|nr:putative leader peptide [Streptomyces durbertensis]
MVMHDVNDANTVGEGAPGALLVARLHVDLCRLSSAMC